MLGGVQAFTDEGTVRRFTPITFYDLWPGDGGPPPSSFERGAEEGRESDKKQQHAELCLHRGRFRRSEGGNAAWPMVVHHHRDDGLRLHY